MKSEKLKAVELFAGIGGFRLGMDAAGIETIWANDIGELACRVYESNFGRGSIVLGDINQVDIADIPNSDLLAAGFPCQPFSPAGKKQGTRDRLRGTLFERIVETIDRKQPRYFLLENVKRLLTMENGQHFRLILKALSALPYFIEWRLVNPLQFGIPQNRDRIFIMGTRVDSQYPDLEELSVFLTDNDADILSLADGDTIKYMFAIGEARTKNHNWGIAYNHQMYSQQLPPLPDIRSRSKIKDIIQQDSEVDSQFDFTADTLERIKQSQKVNRHCNGVEILYNQKGGARLGYTIFGTNGVASTLTASTSRHYERYKIGSKFRRLTNIEYARLMGFPDRWCRVARVYDRYALFGNAVVPACVEWICRRIGQRNFSFQNRTFFPSLYDRILANSVSTQFKSKIVL
ncbi:MAG: DNA cytosine methyltransferase [Oscillatoria sp. SIO1A7]|nr:DNA cytosine methyltransferase [Oscillatoria sp. SIO1A7]